MNRGTQPLVDIVPTVVEVTGNRHIYISPNMHVEKIMPGKEFDIQPLSRPTKDLRMEQLVSA